MTHARPQARNARHQPRQIATLALLLGALACTSQRPQTQAGRLPPAHAEPATPVALVSVTSTAEATIPANSGALSSWTDGPSQRAIRAFIDKITQPDSPEFLAPSERIAVFDNDGTLWSEQPIYVQLAFALDRIQELAPLHPEWHHEEPYKAALARDAEAILTGGIDNWFKLVLATHAGMTSEEFSEIVLHWIKTARHPQHQRPYTDLVYAPMLELIGFLEAHDFKCFIVSGGGLEFMRPWAEATYGIPPERVIGSRVKTKWEVTAEAPVLRRLHEVAFINDGAAKPVAIYESIGRRPIFAAGNSDGDLQMLEWTTATTGPSLALLVHHTDGEREVAYDRNSRVGKLDKALDTATQSGWVVVNVRDEWRRLFSFQPSAAPEPAR